MQFERLGPYKIGSRLGRGGMGAVFEAVNVDTGQPAAIKILNPHLADDEGFRERFELEIETLKKLKHPNIVRMFGYGEEQSYLYYAMELVKGHSVEEELQQGRRFTWREVVQHATKLCKALRHAHDHGVIHRDIKPANLLLADDDGEIKLTDFGIARLFGNSRMTMEGGLIGTAEYMSPEQAAGERVVPQSDLYSLGSVMFAMLAGRPPFRSGSLPDMLHMQRFDTAPPVSRFVTGIPPEVEEVIARLLSKDPQGRAPNALVLSRQLGSMEHGLSFIRQRPAENGGGGGVTLSPERTVSEHQEAVNLGSATKQSEPFPPVGYDPNAPTLVAPSASAVAAPAVVQPMREPRTGASNAASGVVARSNRTANDKPSISSSSPQQEPLPASAEVDPKATIVQSRFRTVEEDERESESLARNSEGGPAVVQIALLALSLAMIAGLLWYFTRPPTAQTLFARIEAAANDSDPAMILNAEDDVQSYLERFPSDEHSATVKQYQEEINLQRLERRFRLRTRGLVHDDTLLPAERDYLEAMNYLPLDPQRTVDRLEAIVKLYGAGNSPSERTAECVELARRELAQLSQQVAKTVPQYLQLIAANLRKADQLRASSPEQARAIWQSIVTLYGDKPWAAASVSKAKAGLAAFNNIPETDPK